MKDKRRIGSKCHLKRKRRDREADEKWQGIEVLN